MDTQVRRDLNISGIISSHGGVYNSVTINGQAKFQGPVDCIDFHCSGRATIQGSVIAQSATIHGLVQINENFTANTMNVHGKTTIGGDLSVEEMEANGFLTVKGNCNAESFRSAGGFQIHGLLNADTISIDLHAPCKAKEIGGGLIRVQKHGISSPFTKLIQSVLPNTLDQLTAETIEGDDIYLENTHAQIVRGNNVTMGRGCEIGLVEYKHQYHCEETAKVKEIRIV